MAEQLSKSIQNIMNTDPSNIDRESDEFKEFLQDGSLDDLTQLAHNAKFDGEDDLLGSVYGEITDRLDQAVRDNFITKEELDDRLNKIDSIIESDPADNNQPVVQIVQKLAATAVTVANKPNNLNTTSANSGKAANTLPNSTKSKSNAPTPLTMPSKIPKPKIKRKSRGNASNSNSKGNNNANAASANTASSKPAPNPNTTPIVISANQLKNLLNIDPNTTNTPNPNTAPATNPNTTPAANKNTNNPNTAPNYNKTPANNPNNSNLPPTQQLNANAIVAGANLAPNPNQDPTSINELIEIENELNEAKNEYARLTAKDRKSYIRSGRVARFLAKIPGLRRFAEKRDQSIETEEAKERYDAASKALIEWELKSLESAGYDEDAKRQEIINVLVDRDLEFENEVVEQRMQQSKKTNKFVNFWERSRGITKIISAGGAGFITGAVLKTAQSMPYVGGYFPGLVVKGAGAAAGAWMAGHVRKRRANAEIKDANGNLVTLAEAQSNEDFNNKKTIIENIVNSADISKGSDSIDVGRISHATEQRTKSEVRGNKLRLATTAIKGFAGASVGEYIVGHAQSMMAGADTNAHHIVGNTNDAAMNNSHSTVPSAESAPTTSAAEPTDTLSAAEPMHSPDTTGMVEGHNFYVQDGSGYSQELIDFANANGQTLTPDQSMELHQHLVDKFGPDYINIDGVTTDTYLDGNDIRLSAPGNASWENGVPDAVREWMMNNGLWNR
ncbi:hypothetical protein EUA65_01055 [TM7 phylum sp. oral taxon 348]|nr:hypothetical protein EUA64_00490 [TM7 phylum sp. oral taxon 348]TWP19327.1 hypothetical protein EUA65_01055 [TM7 phylum sp. oral taxon 348]